MKLRGVVQTGFAGFRGPIAVPTEEIDGLFRIFVGRGLDSIIQVFRKIPDYMREIREPVTEDGYGWWHGWIFGGPGEEIAILVPYTDADRLLVVYVNGETRGRVLVDVLRQIREGLEVLRADQAINLATDTYVASRTGVRSTGSGIST